ncbi:hypothetical protein DXG01_011335 [Tephrocybe rancida]|nr:hypothetical protein DXG01_011335 [Tephrocybe rancida]
MCWLRLILSSHWSKASAVPAVHTGPVEHTSLLSPDLSLQGQVTVQNPTAPTAAAQFRALMNDDARELLSITRDGHALPLWRLDQIQIQYGVCRAVPWSILGFQLEKGKDTKDCIKVELKATIESQGATVKGIWPHRTANALTRFPTKHTSQTQFQIGIDSTGQVATSLGLTDALEHASETGQTLLPAFTTDGFEAVLGVDKRSPRGTYVAELIEVFVLLQLSEERQPITLQVTSNVTYKSRFQMKTVSGSKVLVCSGKEKDDIKRGDVQEVLENDKA